MQTFQVKIDGTTDRDVVCALAYLAGFPEGSQVITTNNYLGIGNSTGISSVYHAERLREVDGDLAEAVAYRGPNIVVGRNFRPPVPMSGELEWQPTNEYVIASDDKVDPQLIGRLKETIRAGPPALHS